MPYASTLYKEVYPILFFCYFHYFVHYFAHISYMDRLLFYSYHSKKMESLSDVVQY